MTENKSQSKKNTASLSLVLKVLKDIGSGKIKVGPEKKLTGKDKAQINALVKEYEQSRRQQKTGVQTRGIISKIQIPGENSIEDNNWKVLMKGLNIQPRNPVEKCDWQTDFVALKESKEAFVERANTWPSVGPRLYDYVVSPADGKDNGDFLGPIAYSGIRSPRFSGIKFPEMRSDEDRRLFAQYTRAIHTYWSNIASVTFKYNDDRATTKAKINACILMATINGRSRNKIAPCLYTHTEDTSMREICGLIGKKVDGSDMTDEEQMHFLSNLANEYVSQVNGMGIGGYDTIVNKGKGQSYQEFASKKKPFLGTISTQIHLRGRD